MGNKSRIFSCIFFWYKPSWNNFTLVILATTLLWNHTAWTFVFYNQSKTFLPRNFNYCLSYWFFFSFQYISYTVVNKCPAPKCKTGYETIDDHFNIPLPLQKNRPQQTMDFFVKWINWWQLIHILSFLNFILKNNISDINNI